jgi:hypothetical protein
MIASPGMPREHGTTRNESQMMKLDTFRTEGVSNQRIFTWVQGAKTAFDG